MKTLGTLNFIPRSIVHRIVRKRCVLIFGKR
ncbi:hypothetical protein [Escherichia phage JM10]